MTLFNLNAKTQTALPLVIFFILFIYTIKPNMLFKPNGKLREFGLFYDNEGYKKTLYNFQFILIIFVILIYYLV